MEGKTLGIALMILAVLAVGFAGINSYFVFDKYSKVGQLTGFTGSSGFVNVTVSAVISVNFSQDAIVWGVGSITAGNNNASLLVTDGGATVTRGNWSTVGVTPLALQNIGSVNVSLKIASDKNETGLFGGATPGHRAYLLNFTQGDSAGCLNDTINLFAWYSANATSPGVKVCSQLGFLNTHHQLNMSVYLAVPYDGTTGVLTSVLTATAATAG